jgi:hypothetical protein
MVFSTISPDWLAGARYSTLQVASHIPLDAGTPH